MRSVVVDKIGSVTQALVAAAGAFAVSKTDPDSTTGDALRHPVDNARAAARGLKNQGAEQAGRLRAALERLPLQDRELLRLSYFEGLAPQELAERLGEPSARIRKPWRPRISTRSASG